MILRVPETNNLPLKNGWLEDDPFLLGFGLYSEKNAANITPFEISPAQQNAFGLLVPKQKIRNPKNVFP